MVSDSSLRVLCTGNPEYRLAQGLKKKIKNIDFISRSSNPSFDLKVQNNQKEVAELSLQYDVFINNSFVDDFVQVFIAKEVWTLWKSKNKKGLIINLGSSVEDFTRPDNRLYGISKKALKEYSRGLYLHSVWHDSGIKCTHLSFGGIQTDKTLATWPHFSHLDIDFCAEKVRDIIELDQYVNIDVIQISPIQKKDKRILKKEVPQQPLAPGEFLVAD